MISIKHLTKIYSSRNKRTVRALDAVSFNLPDKGLIFVVGKSGSGKSTLLNLLGGLDSATEGEIIVDGMRFSQMKKEFDSFRNDYIGFIFQDFNLLEKLTVFENVAFALDLQAKSDPQRVKDIIGLVELDGYEERYPVELSGGQQQRVAIARALVKDPRLLLADEPTGNLDSVTAKKIFELLKKLSRDKLVVVVSHSIESATRYGDRIIELGEGRIVSDVTKVERGEPREDEIELPYGAIDKEELNAINERVKAGGVTLVQKDAFEMTREPACEDREAEPLKRHNFPLKRAAWLSFKFLKAPSLISTVVAVAFVVVVFTLCLLLYNFDSNDLLRQMGTSEEGLFFLYKGYRSSDIDDTLSLDRFVEVTEEDIKAFEDSAYDGKVFKLYNMPVPIASFMIDSGYMPRVKDVYRNFYSSTMLGVLGVDEDFLAKIFGDYEVIAGDLHDKPYGVVITDYAADSIIFRSMVEGEPMTYADFVGVDNFRQRYYINAVISTGYKEKFASFMALCEEAIKDGNVTKAERTAISQHEDYNKFVKDAQNKLNLAYALNDDYIEQVLEHPCESLHHGRIISADVFDESGEQKLTDFGCYALDEQLFGMDLKKDEVRMSIWLYNSLFDANLTAEDMSGFESRRFSIRDFRKYDFDRYDPLFEMTFTVVGVADFGEGLIADSEVVKALKAYDVYPYALVFEGEENVAGLLDVANARGFAPGAMEYKDVYGVIGVMNVYGDLFLILALVVLFVGLILLVAYGMKSVKSRTGEIGIIRALGMGGKYAAVIFALQMLFAAALICVLSIVGQILLIRYADVLLREGLTSILNNNIFMEMSLISFSPAIAATSVGAVIIIIVLSAILQVIRLGKMKPVNILKKSE